MLFIVAIYIGVPTALRGLATRREKNNKVAFLPSKDSGHLRHSQSVEKLCFALKEQPMVSAFCMPTAHWVDAQADLAFA